MREFIYDSWNGIMNADINPLKHIPDTNTRLNQTKLINKVCPISGCKINNNKIGKTNKALKKNLK